jgi:hypothetical protein
MQLAQDRNQWWYFVSMVMKIPGFITYGKFTDYVGNNWLSEMVSAPWS